MVFSFLDCSNFDVTSNDSLKLKSDNQPIMYIISNLILKLKINA